MAAAAQYRCRHSEHAIYRDFDDNLRQAFRQETELFFDSVLRENRSVLDLIRADYTFLNERLAKHYGIPNVYGSRFRRVTLAPDSHRGGLLRQGSVLSVTSYATRTSPVIRGVWVLEQYLRRAAAAAAAERAGARREHGGRQSPDAREAGRASQQRRVRELPSHDRPGGLRARELQRSGTVAGPRRTDEPIDVAGSFAGAGEFRGVAGLEDALLSRPELFAGTMTEKLLTFALGRGVEYYDAPAVRKIVRDAEKDGYRFSSLILGIVKSMPFQMRKIMVGRRA